jgi:hypothetical protein
MYVYTCVHACAPAHIRMCTHTNAGKEHKSSVLPGLPGPVIGADGVVTLEDLDTIKFITIDNADR